MAANVTAMPPGAPSDTSSGRAQLTGGAAEAGHAEASDTRQPPTHVADSAQPQEGQQSGEDAVLTRSVRTAAWLWGLLPGVLAGAAIAYLELSMGAEDVVEECNTSDCRYATELLKSTLDRSFKPCDDFYSFVCSRYAGPQYSVLASMTMYMRDVTEGLLYTIKVPPSRQNSTQKAAGLFRACISMANYTKSEVPSLKKFLNLVGLDISDMPPDPKFSIAERIVRLNFEYGFPTVVEFGFIVAKAVEKKILDLKIDDGYTSWLKRDASVSLRKAYLHEYDAHLDTSQLIVRIVETERKLLNLIRSLEATSSDTVLSTTVGEFGTLTGEFVEKAEWLRLIVQYTGGGYNSSDVFVVWANSTEVIKLLVANSDISLEDARLVLSWNLIRQLLPLSSGRLMTMIAKDEDFRDTCFRTVLGIMEVAVMSSYLRRLVRPAVLSSATAMALNLMQALRDKLHHARWMQGWMQDNSIAKASKMGLVVGYPKDTDTIPQMEAFYADFPDAGEDFFGTWLDARRVIKQRLFRGGTVTFSVGEANAFYKPLTNTMTIEAGIVQPPLFFENGTAALNYGGLGQDVGHEIMHGYDVTGIVLDALGGRVPIADNSSMRQYELRLLCLRQTYRQAEAERAMVLLDDKVDSEGFADFTGLQLAYAAYKRLNPRERLAVIPDVGLSAEQTFFVAHCLKWCDLIARRHPSSRYWPGRSRCIVPLRNMPEFAAAFSCSEGASMNPRSKCSFWD